MQRNLYFTAAALFGIAALLSLFSEGISVKTGFGLVMAGSMVWLGMKTKAPSS